MDVKAGCLYDDLIENICMKQPHGYEERTKPDHVCKIQKDLYGLRQGPGQWYSKSAALFEQKLQVGSCSYETCFYVKRTSNFGLMLALYVDDIIIDGSFLERLKSVKTVPPETFEVNNLGVLESCLAIEISRNRS